MNTGWQDIAALGLVALALTYLGRRTWRRFVSTSRRMSTGCASGCSSCPASAAKGFASEPSALVTIESLTPVPRR